MPIQDEHDHKTDQPLSSTDSDDSTENIKGSIKSLLLAIAGVVLVLSIMVLLPMGLTYLSEGDFRAIGGGDHPTDTARKLRQAAYTSEDDYRAPAELYPTDTASKRFHNTYKPDK